MALRTVEKQRCWNADGSANTWWMSPTMCARKRSASVKLSDNRHKSTCQNLCGKFDHTRGNNSVTGYLFESSSYTRLTTWKASVCRDYSWALKQRPVIAFRWSSLSVLNNPNVDVKKGWHSHSDSWTFVKRRRFPSWRWNCVSWEVKLLIAPDAHKPLLPCSS